MQLYGSVVGAVFQLFASTLELVATALRAIATSVFWVMAVFSVVMLLFLFYEQSPSTVREFIRVWNSSLGPLLYYGLVWPLRGLGLVVGNVVPIFNFVVSIVGNVLVSVSFSTATLFGGQLLELATNLGVSVTLFINSFFTFVTTIDEKVHRCESVGVACFEVTEWTLEPSLAFVGPIVRNGITIVTGMCPVFAIPFDFAFYPLTDPNLPAAVSGSINFVVHLFAEMPRITAQRCRLKRDEVGVVACLPDIQRLYEHTAAFMRRWAALFDNWLDMALVITEAALNQQTPACASLDKRGRVVEYSEAAFNSSVSVLAALSQSQFAITDGAKIQYVDSARMTQEIISPLGTGWPVQVDASLGVAVIDSVDGGVEPALFGCRCEDNAGVMRILCAVAASMDEQAEDAKQTVIEVSFQVGATAEVLTCATSKIMVQSVRWPSVRYTAVNEAPELVAQRRVDAAVWVMPLCLGASLACAERAIVTSCYPYCIALHERASPSRRMVLYDAQQWEEYVHIFGRDCVVVGTGGLTNMGQVMSGGQKLGENTLSVQVEGSVLPEFSSLDAVFSADTQVECMPSPVSYSTVPKSMYGSQAYKDSLNSVRTDAQPFVVAGDTALIGNYNFSDFTFSVTALRIFGNSRNEFTMKVIAEGIPANPPVETLSRNSGKNIAQELNEVLGDQLPVLEVDEKVSQVYFESGRITLPYRFSSSAFGQYVAVQTRTGLVYATNPTLHTWRAYMTYCATGLGVTQLMILSSYHPLMLTFVTVGVNKVELAGNIYFNEPGDDPIDFQKITADSCTNMFSVAVTSLELVDDLNVAASVLYTTFDAGLDPFSDPRTRTRIFFINTQTLERRENVPWDPPLPRQPSDDAIQLCPGLRRMPQIGTIAVDGVLAVSVLAKAFVDVPFVIAGLVPYWKQRSVACPVESYGHTALQRCGSELFDFVDEFFDLVEDLNNHFWRSLVYIANLLPAGSGVQGVANGMYNFGRARLRPYVRGISMQVTQLGGFNPVESMAGFANTGFGAITPVNVFGLFQKAVLSPARWTRFLLRGVFNALSEIVPSAVRGDVKGVFNTLWLEFYMARGRFSTQVINHGITACAGMSLALGGTSPFARFVMYGCEAPLLLMEGTLDFALTATVDVGFSACMCYGPEGEAWEVFVYEKCLQSAPPHLNSMMLRTISGEISPQDACAAFRGVLRDRLESAMDPTFTKLFAASEQLGLILDWFRTWLGMDDGGECLNFDTDPYVAALIPEPVDYFRVCGQTEYCELRCAGPIAHFDALSAQDTLRFEDEVITDNVETLFFATDTASKSSFRSVLALYQSFTCPPSAQCASCVYVLGVEDETVDTVVGVYCIPIGVGRGIFLVERWILTGISGNSVSMGAFLDVTHVLLVTVMNGGARLKAARFLTGEPVDIYSALRTDITQVTYLVANEGNVLMHFWMGGATMSRKCFTFIFWGYGRLEIATEADCADISAKFAKHHVVWLPGNEALLIPSAASMDEQDVRVVKVLWSQQKVSEEEEVVGKMRNFAYGAGVVEFYKRIEEQEKVGRTPRLLAQNVVNYAAGERFAILSAEDSATRMSWLAEVRLEPRGSQALMGVRRTHSREEQLTVRVEQQCNRMSCAGCYKRATQVACHVMQQCMVGSCVGTLVNQRRPLCAIGLTLKSMLDMYIEMYRGAFMVIAETLAEVYELALKDYTRFEAAWPDEAFFGLLCTGKDVLAYLTSVLTSVVNLAVQKVLSMPLDSVSGGALSVDANMRAVTTMATQAINQVLFQISLGPLYGFIAMQKLVVCQTNSIIALFDFTNAEVTLGNPELQAAGGGMASCVPEGMQETTNVLGESGQRKSLVSQVGDFYQTFFNDLILLSMTTIIDVVFAYAQGIVTGFEDLVQTIDMAHCKMPDFYMNDVFDCVCGDKPMAIPDVRSNEGLTDAAFWCTGTLEMIGTDGIPFIVYNPYTLREIEEELGKTETAPSGAVFSKLDRYLLCLSRPQKYEEEFGRQDVCASIRPSLFQLARQNVDTIAVMGRCRANYHLKEWDPGAYALFTDARPNFVSRGEIDSLNDAKLITVQNCLVSTHALKQGNTACLDAFLSEYSDPRFPSLSAGGISRELYFSYEYVDPEKHSSAATDACEVFSGPAETNAMFAACMTDSGARCQIAPFVWSARSGNKVPVAVRHKRTGGSDEMRYEEALDLLEKARNEMRQAFEQADEWAGADHEDIQVALFSAEGDFLHQIFDCAFMGAMDSADLWPLRERGMTVPTWWRNEDGSREFQPCTLEKLGDDTALPFTCGSQTRRGIMKYFVRDFFMSGDDRKNNTFLVDLVKDRIDELRVKYGYTDPGTNLEDIYACKCSTNERSFACCENAQETQFTTDGLNSARFDEIPTKNIADLLLARSKKFFSESLRSTNTDPWWKYLDDAFAKQLQWDRVGSIASVAADSYVFSVFKDLLFLNASDVGGPFENGTASLWHTCTALLGQRMSSMPLKANSTGWFPSSIDRLRYDNRQGDLRTFATLLMQELDAESPTTVSRDWRHAPSYSTVCKTTDLQAAHSTPSQMTLVSTSNVPASLEVDYSKKGKVFGAAAFKLGASAECFCGWFGPSSDYCEIPANVYALIPDTMRASLAISSSSLYTRDKNEAVTKAILLSAVSLAGSCPYLDFSDHWGVLTPAAASEVAADAAALKATYSMSADDVIAHGRGGLRLEAWERLINKEDFTVEETDRVKKLVAEDGYDLVTQPFCYDASAPASMPSNDEMLFPVIQVVTEAMPLAACSRYVVEAAKYHYLDTKSASAGTLQNIAQQFMVEKWRDRCNANLHLLSTCNHFNVLEFVPESPPPAECPFSISGTDKHYVTQTGCVVYVEAADKFYDPCSCFDCSTGNLALTLSQIQTKTAPSCELWFDPRKLSNSWGQTVPVDFVDKLMQRLAGDQFEGGVWDAHDYCDGFVDWWPEAWEHPVGYHVTTQCHPAEAGYRTFDSHVFVERPDADSAHMRLAVNELRDADLGASHWGTGGMCRKTTYGFPLFELNDLRLCTRRGKNERFDPLSSNTLNAVFEDDTAGAFSCAPTGDAVPWHFDDDYPLPARYRAFGTVPALLQPNRPAHLLPLAGIVKNSGTNFYTSPRCHADAECAGGRCRHGICFNYPQHGGPECVMHSECPGTLVCAADGRCVPVRVYIENMLEDDVEIELHATSCQPGDTNHQLLRTSRYGQIDRLLHAHGFCGYHEWYDYHRNLYGRTGPLNVYSEDWLNSSALYQIEALSIFDSGLMKLVPHPCDVNYQYSDDRQACSPAQSSDVKQTDFFTTIDIEGTLKMFNTSVAIDDPDFKNLNMLDIDTNGQLKKCSDITQCIDVEFLWNNQPSNYFTNTDLFTCGPGLKSYSDNTCKFDLHVAPFANVLCPLTTAEETPCIDLIDRSILDRVCQNMDNVWSAEVIRGSSAHKFNEMYTVFTIPTNLDRRSYVQAVKCANFLQKSLPILPGETQSRYVYQSFQYSLYAVPFSWWFKCIFLQGRNAGFADPTNSFACPEWTDKPDAVERNWWLQELVYTFDFKEYTSQRIKDRCDDQKKITTSHTAHNQYRDKRGYAKLQYKCQPQREFDHTSTETVLRLLEGGTIDEKMNCLFYDADTETWYTNNACQMDIRDDAFRRHAKYAVNHPDGLTAYYEVLYQLLRHEDLSNTDFSGRLNDDLVVNMCVGDTINDIASWAEDKWSPRDESEDNFYFEASDNDDVVLDLYDLQDLESADIQTLMLSKFSNSQNGFSDTDYVKDNSDRIKSSHITQQFYDYVTGNTNAFFFGTPFCALTYRIGGDFDNVWKCDFRLDIDLNQYSYYPLHLPCSDDNVEIYKTHGGQTRPVTTRACDASNGIYEKQSTFAVDCFLPSDGKRYTIEESNSNYVIILALTCASYKDSYDSVENFRDYYWDKLNTIVSYENYYLGRMLNYNVDIDWFRDSECTGLASPLTISDSVYTTSSEIYKPFVQSTYWNRNADFSLNVLFDDFTNRQLCDIDSDNTNLCSCFISYDREDQPYVIDYPVQSNTPTTREKVSLTIPRRKLAIKKEGAWSCGLFYYGKDYSDDCCTGSHLFNNKCTCLPEDLDDGQQRNYDTCCDYVQREWTQPSNVRNELRRQYTELKNAYYSTENMWVDQDSEIYRYFTDDFDEFNTYDASLNIIRDDLFSKNEDDISACTDGSKSINYYECNFVDRLLQLRDYINTHYRSAAFHVLRAPAKTASMTPSFSNFSVNDGAIISFARRSASVLNHIDDLLPDDLTQYCKVSANAIRQLYCHIGDEGDVTPLNPWFGGDYNPLEGCDTRDENFALELVDSKCANYVCNLDEQAAFLDNAPGGVLCSHGRTVTDRRLGRGGEVDLCTKAQTFATECSLEAGLLGGGKGTPVKDLYTASDFVCNKDTKTFFTSEGVNPLFYQEDVDNACLQFAENEIGPTSVWLSVREVGGQAKLVVDKVGLASDPPFQGDKADTWVYTLADDCAEDLAEYERIYGGDDWTYSTPYERMAFWLGRHWRKPVYPDPSRAAVMFEDGKGGCGGANPLHGVADMFVHSNTMARTPDGVCSCVHSGECSQCPTADSILAFVDPSSQGLPTSSQISTAYATFHDWPQMSTASLYRDGTYQNYRDSPDGTRQMFNIYQVLEPEILTRLPKFKVRAMRTAQSAKHSDRLVPGHTTLSEGGDCHMGRAARTTGASPWDNEDCSLVEKTSSWYRFECVDAGGNFRSVTLDRETPRAPPDAAKSMRDARRKCSACKVPSSSGEPETSFGVPVRLAPSRRIMRHLQALMAEYEDTAAWGAPHSASARATFVEDVLRPAAMEFFTDDEAARVAVLEALFAEEWVFCTDEECKGSIPYQEWAAASSGDRLQMCYDKLMTETNDGADLIVTIEMCDMDSVLDDICTKLRAANQSVFDANCQASGLCLADTFTYAPAVYSVSNNDFVRMSVQNFYLRHDNSVCPARDEDEEALRQQNIAAQQDCPSTYVHAFNMLLSEMRLIAHMIARIMFYFSNLVGALFRTLIPSAGSEVVDEIMNWFNKFLEETKDLLLQVAKLAMELVLNISEAGQVIRDAIKEMCKWVAWLLDKIGILWCNVVKPVIDVFMDVLRAIKSGFEDAINSIPLVSGYKFTALDGMLSLLQGFLDLVAGFLCNEDMMSCDFEAVGEPTIPSGALPAATRCWAEFVPYAAVATSLACSRSDTCVAEDLSSEKVMCDACPVQDGVTFNNFGCNLLTKRCSCKTQPRTITYCSENSQCSLDASCLMVDKAFSTSAWGVDLCTACMTSPMCIYDGSESVGKCACPYTTPTMSLCSTESIGYTVFLQDMSASAMCFFTFSSDIAQGSTSSVSADSLVVVPCSLVDPTAVVCVWVDNTPSVVAFRLIETAGASRRLLALPIADFFSGSAANYELAEAITQFADWNRTAEPCRSLVHAHHLEEKMGPVDLYVLQQCIFWRMVGNMTRGVPDTLYLSVEDAISAVASDPTVLFKALASLQDTVSAVLKLWPAAGNFVAHVAPLLDGRNDSWLVLTQELLLSSAGQRRANANWDAYAHLAEQHSSRRLMADTPRIEDLSEDAIDANVEEKEAALQRTLNNLGVGDKIAPGDLKGLLFSSAIFSASGFDDFLSSRQQDPALPTYDYWVDADGDGSLDWNTCPIVAITIEEVKKSVELLQRFYKDGYRRLNISEVLNVTAALPKIKVKKEQTQSAAEPNDAGFVNKAIFAAVSLFQKYTGITSGKFAAMLQCTDEEDTFSICNFVRGLFKCDNEAVQLCSKRNHSLYLGAFLCLLLYMLLAYILNIVGLGTFSFWLWVSFPAYVMWYTYGYSPRCFPMVPTCLVDDLVFPVYYLLPRQLRISSALELEPGCWQDPSIAPEACLRSCVSDPVFNYQSLSATYAQFVCEAYGVECADAARFMPPEWLHWLITPEDFERDLGHKAQAQYNYRSDTPNEDEIVAQRFCMLAGLMFAAPYAVGAWVAALLVLAIPVALFRPLASAIQVFLQMVFYSHLSTA